MTKLTKVLATASTMFVLTTGVALAAPAERTAGFICPVLNETVGEHNPNTVEISGGDFSIIGPEVNVALNATNQNGSGTPGGDHASPGDTDYTHLSGLIK